MSNHVDADTVQTRDSTSLRGSLWGFATTVLAVLYTAVFASTAAACAALGWPRAIGGLGRLWARLIIGTARVKVEIVGVERVKGLKSYVLVANHQSFFDIFAVLACMPGYTRFVAKKELLKIPIFGYALDRGGHVIIDRQHGGRAIRKALETAKENYPICVFAEGHRYNDNSVHPFNDGAAWLAIMAGLPCVPLSISGSGAFFPREAKFVVPGKKMRMVVGEPIPTENLVSADRSALTKRLEQAVKESFVTEV